MKNKTKPGIKIYVNILPLVIIFLLIGGAGYFLFGQDIELPSFKPGSSIKVTRIDNFPQRITVETEREKTNEVITSEEALTRYMATIDPKGQIDLKEDFNFNKNFLVAVSSSTLEGPLNRYKIKKVERDSEDKKLTIQKELTIPMSECIDKVTEEEASVKSIIVDMVIISKNDWEIDFEALKKELPCEEF